MKRLKKLQKHPESKKQELTVEKIIFETRVAGAGFYEALDFTWGEAIEFIKIYNERRKRENQDLATIAFREADLMSQWIFKKEETNITEVFPFWSEAEKNEATKQANINKYKNIMYRYVNNTKINK